ncbi:hypothetical protein [Megalodesulfovibrio gigas]|uniref:DUF3574 domain-containing protein n=1 Tax=Megalodesulfovibrio gigas (strain ATCC 19364 / DSM 1382 / NCIMB 9332 / VKM B-1759) TaxID=1121448 RepID=T2G730_MEGG1|nr:hypothetical protein [Megalodesulfovibrio gigas]AGW12058.1 hypothetical protein DGI_0121 [Megalodesulfovibrio gigas DSM 1382 = ATCC 19364]
MNRACMMFLRVAVLGGVLVCAALGMVWPAASWAEDLQQNAFIHFFVVPTQGEGVEAATEALKGELVDLAGGYTELGAASGGDRDADGSLHRSDHRAFLVAARKDLSMQLEALLAATFHKEKPFMLVWQGNCSLYRN